MIMGYLLQDITAAANCDPQTAQKVLTYLQAVGVAPCKLVESYETSAQIYRLRGEGIPPDGLAIRFQRSTRQVLRLIHDHAARRRQALRMVA